MLHCVFHVFSFFKGQVAHRRRAEQATQLHCLQLLVPYLLWPGV